MGGLGGLSTPLWSGQLTGCMTTIVTDKQQLVAKTNNKLTGLALNRSFSSLLGLKQPSLSLSCLQERVNEGRGQIFWDMAKILHVFGPSSNPGRTTDEYMAHKWHPMRHRSIGN